MVFGYLLNKRLELISGVNLRELLATKNLRLGTSEYLGDLSYVLSDDMGFIVGYKNEE